MGVISVTEADYESGSFSGEEYTYTVVYWVETTSDTGPDTIRRDGRFRIGSAYVFGNDVNTSARLKELEVSRRSPGSRTQWEVSCTYSTAQPESGDDGGNNRPRGDSNNNEPDLGLSSREETFEIRTHTVQEPGYMWEWLGSGVASGSVAGCCQWARDESIAAVCGDILTSEGVSAEVREASEYFGPIVNSAGVPQDPQYTTRQLSMMRYSVLMPQSEREDMIALHDTINLNPVNVYDIAGNLVKHCDKGTLLFSNFSQEPATRYDEFTVWCVFEFIYDECGHGVYTIDAGTHTHTGGEEVDTLASGELAPREDIVKIDGIEHFKDDAGDIVDDDVWLNGRGQKLPGNRKQPIIMKWRDGQCKLADFSKIYPIKEYKAK